MASTTQSDCPSCGHAKVSHQTGRCAVTGSASAGGVVTYDPDCGCTFLALDMTCPMCGTRFVCAQGHDQHECYSCYVRAIEDEAEASFAPLTHALREVGILAQPVWNTGGNVMCLPVAEAFLPTVEVDGKTHQPYLLFSDDAEVSGCGLYLDSDSTGINLSPSWWDEVVGEDYPEHGWAEGDLAARTARWLESIREPLMEWFTTIEWRTSEVTYIGKTFTEFHATYDPLVLGAGTIVTDYDAA